jgi:hypothetical protein
MIMHLWGPLSGGHNDRLLLSRSKINEEMKDAQRDPTTGIHINTIIMPLSIINV